jgi:hypothetical protein
MSNRKLAILGVVAAFMVIWAVAQSRISSSKKTESGELTYLIQGLNTADIGSIVLGTGGNAVTLKRNQGHFVVVNKDNYPADASRINELITACLGIQTTELYTDEKANHKDLGVTEEDARSVVKFFKQDSSPITGVIIGKDREKGRGAYVRLTSNDKVYVTPEAPWIKSRAMDYIDQQLITINRDDIESVTVSYPGGNYTLSKGDKGIILENLPEGKKLKKSKACEQIFNALTNLRFDDVMGKVSEKNLNFEKQYVCKLKDSTVYTISITRKDGKSYVSCDCEFTDKTPVTKERSIESEEDLKKKEAKLLAQDKANEFSAKHKGWVYEISEGTANLMTKQPSELVEDVKEPNETKPVSDANVK